MKCRDALNKSAAEVLLLLAVIFTIITACGIVAAPANPTETSAAVAPTFTATSSLPLATFTPQSTATSLSPTLTPSPTPTSTAEASSTATSTQLPPTATPQINESNKEMTTSNAAVQLYESTITLPTYPFKDYLAEQIDPVYNIPVYYFNRAAYQAANPTPTPVEYNTVVLENPYLRLTFLPALGGRLYSAVLKATEQEVFYHNPVVKPSRYGGLQPAEANWWLATGGMEWAYPTHEHGYRFGVPWDYQVSKSGNRATLTLSDTAAGRVGLEVTVTLPADSAAFTVAPILINGGPDSAPVQLWTNAALTLSASSMSLNTHFIVPTDIVTVHSRGEPGWSVPAGHEPSPWPQVGQTDLSDYSQWANYLGFFVPNAGTPFVGAHNPETDLGIVRLPPPEPASGSSKLFAFGSNFPDRSYTEDESQYFEIWGGANASFWPEDDIMLPVGDTLGWQEQWWPLAGLGGLTWATETVAIHLEPTSAGVTLSALVSRPTQGKLQVQLEGETATREQHFAADPATPLLWEFEAKPVHIKLIDQNGNILLEYPAN